MDRRVGAALVVAGIVLLLVPQAVIVRHAIVYTIDKYLFFYANYPEGTKDDPFAVFPGETVRFNVSASYYVKNSATYETLWYISGDWDVQVLIYKCRDDWTLITPELTYGDLKYITSDFGTKEKGGTKYWCWTYVFATDGKFSWTPAEEGKYAAVFKVFVREDTTDVGTVTKTVYLEVMSAPDGYFNVEGRSADENTKILCVDGTINIEFFATSRGEEIDRVYVEVYRGDSLVTTITLSEVTADYKWEGSWAPTPGTYELKGYIEYDGVTSRLMTLLTGFKEEEAPAYRLLPRLTVLDYLGILLVAVGVFLLLRRRVG